MMKRLLLISALLLLFSACSAENAGKTEEISHESEQVEEEELAEDEADELEESDQEEADAEETEEDPAETETEESQDKADDEKKAEAESSKDVAHNIMLAQANKDYSYLKSVLGKGASVNEENKTIEFNTGDASHTFDIITTMDEDDFEFRFLEEDDNSERAIAGFGIIDYENESSYVTEMILRLEDGKWKLTSIDINK